MIGRISRWFRRFFALDRRWGVRFGGGTERTGMYSRLEAEHYLRDRNLVGITYYYDPLDLRMLGADKAERTSFRP